MNGTAKRPTTKSSRHQLIVDLLAGHPTKCVEVMDRRIAEQPARAGDVCLGRRYMIVGDQADQVHGPELSGFDESAGFQVGQIESALEADLDGRLACLDEVDELHGLS